MPFSRSRSPESMTRSSTLSAWCAVKAPACRSIASTSVVLPWSTWATIATLRRFAVLRSVSGTRVNFTVRRPPDPHRRTDRARGLAGGRRDAVPWRHAPIATNTRVEREELLDFVRTRHHLVLVTTRATGGRSSRRSPAASTPTAGSSSRRTPTAPRPSTCAATRAPACSCSPTSGTTPRCRSTAPPRCSTCRARRPRTGWSSTSAASPASTPTGTSTARRCASRASRWSGSPRALGAGRHRRVPARPGAV